MHWPSRFQFLTKHRANQLSSLQFLASHERRFTSTTVTGATDHFQVVVDPATVVTVLAAQTPECLLAAARAGAFVAALTATSSCCTAVRSWREVAFVCRVLQLATVTTLGVLA